MSSISAGFQVSFQFELKTYISVDVFEEDGLIYPGDLPTLDITLLNAEEFLPKLYKGLDFEVSDNSGIIASGVITEVYS